MLTKGQLADRISHFERACQEAGIKLTHQRIEVLREVSTFGGHPSVTEILEGIRARIPTISVDTVYRTLRLLNDLGLISTLGHRRGAVRFDANLEPHNHYFCIRCGATTDIATLDFGRLSAPEAIADLGSVESVDLEIRGVCVACAAMGDESLDSASSVTDATGWE